MEHELDIPDRSPGRLEVGQVAFYEVHCWKVREVGPLARAEVVENADGVAATHERFGQMRSDEPGAAGDEVLGHIGKPSWSGGPHSLSVRPGTR